MSNVRAYLLDLLERIAKTFSQVFIGQLFVSGTGIGPDQVVAAVRDWDGLEKAFVSAAAAVVALVMGLILGWANGGTASAVPKRLLPGEAGQSVVAIALAIVVAAVILKACGVW